MQNFIVIKNTNRFRIFFSLIIIQILLINIFCEEESNKNSTEQMGYDLTKIYKFNCTNSRIDCSGNGVCSEDGLKCECNTGYQTFYENFEDYLNQDVIIKVNIKLKRYYFHYLYHLEVLISMLGIH